MSIAIDCHNASYVTWLNILKIKPKEFLEVNFNFDAFGGALQDWHELRSLIWNKLQLIGDSTTALQKWGFRGFLFRFKRNSRKHKNEYLDNDEFNDNLFQNHNYNITEIISEKKSYYKGWGADGYIWNQLIEWWLYMISI